ncbi:peptidylprolyl isomerase [Leptothoe sp. PORK10 BA2]|uniref:peptidylprolyl isomerase n=1 Tax=Leptothoe sp. PORK10 BA2 TaxID=3110254 RepID=UPI002B203ABD|nr:peptidylprolyl isomerase [Leptothoe sp. PORK10 BA2]MEA5466586.1 peptidylprolyl isomerase [Leptothoe sp. PORK10 BA2]
MADFSQARFTPDEVVSYLRQTSQLRGIYKKLLSQQVIQQGAQVRNLTVTPSEIQAEAEELRRKNHLEKAADTLAWLTEQLMDPEDWEAGICSHLLEKKLAASLFDAEVEKYFSQNKLQFDQVLLYQLQVQDYHFAQEIRYQILEKESSFHSAAHRYDSDPDRSLRCGYEGKISRWKLEPAVAAAVFGAPIGTLIGPIEINSSYGLLMVEAFISAQLTDEVRQEIIQDLFEEWLEREINYLLYSEVDDGGRAQGFREKKQTPMPVEMVPRE